MNEEIYVFSNEIRMNRGALLDGVKEKINRNTASA
jgi:hypothetical protein